MPNQSFLPRPRVAEHRDRETTTFPIDFREMAGTIRNLADSTGMSRSEFVRQCVRYALDMLDEKMEHLT